MLSQCCVPAGELRDGLNCAITFSLNYNIRRMAENGFAPPLGNFADISYLVEN